MDEDKTYYDFLPKVENWVRRWAMMDDTLRYQIKDLTEDARSFAYLKWLEAKERFKEDAPKYYLFTIAKRMDTYFNWFYKQQYYNSYAKKHTGNKEDCRVVAFEKVEGDKTYTVPKGKEPVPFWDLCDDEALLTPPADKFLDNTEKLYVDIMDLVIKEIANEPDKYQELILDIIKSGYKTMGTPLVVSVKSKGRTTRQRFYANVNEVAQRHNIKRNTAVNMWSRFKIRLRNKYPDIVAYLRTGEEEFLKDFSTYRV